MAVGGLRLYWKRSPDPFLHGADLSLEELSCRPILPIALHLGGVPNNHSAQWKVSRSAACCSGGDSGGAGAPLGLE